MQQGGRVPVSQTPLGERVPSAVVVICTADAWGNCLKPLSGNVCLRPSAAHSGLRGPEWVSNPSRGTCAFGQTKAYALNLTRLTGLKPLSGNVCLRPLFRGMYDCINEGLKPLSGNVCLRPEVWASQDTLTGVSNPSRGTCAFGRNASC